MIVIERQTNNGIFVTEIRTFPESWLGNSTTYGNSSSQEQDE